MPCVSWTLGTITDPEVMDGTGVPLKTVLSVWTLVGSYILKVGHPRYDQCRAHRLYTGSYTGSCRIQLYINGQLALANPYPRTSHCTPL